MPAKITNRACLLAIAALTLCALLLQPRADILSADTSEWHAAPPSYHLHSISIPAPYSVFGTLSLVDMVAHVKLKSIRAKAQQDWGSNYYPETEGSTSYDPEIWFEFEVLEYFKGSGGNKIWGIVVVDASGQPTAIAAREVATQYIRHIDPLHTGEAVVFMIDYSSSAPNTRQPNHYHLGWIRGNHWSSEASNSYEDYSLAAYRRWLPLASQDGISGSSEEPQFMLQHPDGNLAGHYPEEISGTVGSPDNSVITLSELRYIAKNEQRLQEQIARNNINHHIRMAAQNLTAEATKDAIILRWNVESLPDIPVPDASRTYLVLRQSIDDDEDPFYAYVEGVRGYPVLRYSDTNLTELTDEIPASASMSYEDKLDILPGTRYVYLVRTLRFGIYHIDALVMITATDGATATGTILPVSKLSADTPTPIATPASDAQSTAPPMSSPTTTTPTPGGAAGQ